MAVANQKTLIGLIILLLISNLVTGWYALNNSSTAKIDELVSHQAEYPFLDPTLPLLDRSNLITNIQELRSYLKALPAQNQDWASISLYVEVINTGANIAVNPDLAIWPSSLTKLPTAMVAMRKVEHGEWMLTETSFEILATDINAHDPNQNNFEVGQSYRLQDLLERMLLDSDNVAYNVLVRNLTPAELASISEAVGIDTFYNSDGRVSAKEYTRLLRALYLSTYLDKEHSNRLLAILNQSEFKGLLRSGLPQGIPFSHKWGINQTVNAYSDSGIVYLEKRPYLISVMIQAKTDDYTRNQQRAEELMKTISSRTFQYMQHYQVK